MNEIHLFYYTGLILWAVACFGVVLLVAFFAIVLPYRVFFISRHALWHWMWAAKIARYGFSQKTLMKVYFGTNIDLPPGVKIASIIEWIGRVKEEAAAEKIKERRRIKK